MNNIEKRLAEVRGAQPSARLDHAIDAMLRWAELDRQRRRRSWRPAWFAVAGCAAGLVLGLLLGLLVQRGAGDRAATPTTVVIVAPSPKLERWLTAVDRPSHRGFLEREHAMLKTEYVAGQDRHDPPDSL